MSGGPVIRKLLIGALVAVVAAIGALWLFVDSVVGSAIERSATDAFGVETKIGFARLRILAGELRLVRVRVANPPGFDEPHFLAVRRIGVDADLRDLRNELVEIPLIEIDGVDVALERDGKRSNYDAILDGMNDFEDEGPEPETSGQHFVVRRLVIRDVQARVEWNAVASKQTKLELTIPEIELRDLGEEGGGLTTAELTHVVTQAILASVVRYGGHLPGAVVSGLGAGLRGLGGAPDGVVRGVEGLAETTLGAGGKLGEAAGSASQKAGDAIRGLFGGGDDE